MSTLNFKPNKREKALFNGRPVLVVVAHCDDEVIFFGSLIRTALACGSKVTVAACSLDRSEKLTKWATSGVRAFALECGYSGRDKSISLNPKSLFPLSHAMSGIIKGTQDRDGCIVVTHGTDGEYGNRFHEFVGAFAADNARLCGCEVWRRDRAGAIVMGEQYAYKQAMFTILYGKYRDVNINSWTRHLRAEERYSRV